jgi:hypothetical protein
MSLYIQLAEGIDRSMSALTCLQQVTRHCRGVGVLAEKHNLLSSRI